MIVSAQLASASQNEFIFDICNPDRFHRLTSGDQHTSGGTEVNVVSAPEEFRELVGEEIIVHFDRSKAYILPVTAKGKAYSLVMLINVREHESELVDP